MNGESLLFGACWGFWVYTQIPAFQKKEWSRPIIGGACLYLAGVLAGKAIGCA